MKPNHVRRGGLASRLKRRLKKAVRSAMVRRWFFVVVVKITIWLIKRLWFDKNRTNFSP
ncbi:MAG TPA: hypothetical protein VMP11_03200 [Verrucomicrobiae bacterium]|nr:hypothetical protein [Verrucomicrobiae bacterium]